MSQEVELRCCLLQLSVWCVDVLCLVFSWFGRILVPSRGAMLFQQVELEVTREDWGAGERRNFFRMRRKVL